jgi:GT2 family glycosyltransferase
MKLVCCLPGKSYSGSFIQCWTETLNYCLKNGIEVFLSQRYSPNIYMVRNMCLGGDGRRGKDQKLFNGQIDYDYILWIDSDTVFNSAQLQKLINRNLDVCAAIYRMQDGTRYTTVVNCNQDYFDHNGEFEFLADEKIAGRQEPIKCSYTGMGFMLVKRGVTEKLEYPWFKPSPVIVGDVEDFMTEDISFCWRLIEKGINIFVDPTVVVGHEKALIL